MRKKAIEKGYEEDQDHRVRYGHAGLVVWPHCRVALQASPFIKRVVLKIAPIERLTYSPMNMNVVSCCRACVYSDASRTVLQRGCFVISLVSFGELHKRARSC